MHPVGFGLVLGYDLRRQAATEWRGTWVFSVGMLLCFLEQLMEARGCLRISAQKYEFLLVNHRLLRDVAHSRPSGTALP